VALLDETSPRSKARSERGPVRSVAGRAGASRRGGCPYRLAPPVPRYGEKLATPDITIADLIGEVDPIKVAEGRYLADASTIHYGLIPRTNRGIFAINELPDLQERIQVGLLNILEERDVQVAANAAAPADLSWS
jgi:magnesium chelatase subunit I